MNLSRLPEASGLSATLRFGGVTGNVLGASGELAETVVLLALGNEAELR